MQRRIAALLIIIGFSTVTLAQDDQPAKKPKPSEVRVFYLKFVSAEDAVAVAKTLFGPDEQTPFKVAADVRTNSLIVSGTATMLDTMEALLGKLDAANKTNEKVMTIRNYRVVKNIDLAHRVLQSMMAGTDARLESSKDSLIVLATDEAHQKIADILKELIREGGDGTDDSYYIHVVWIVGTSDATKDWKLHAIPPQLRDLVERKLAPRLALKSPKMVSQMLVRTSLEGNSTQVHASGSGALSEAAGFRFLCQAEVSPRDNGVSLKIDLNAGISNTSVAVQGASSANDNDLSTSIALKLDHPVCLGTSPSNGVDSVFVIQVSKQWE